MDRGSRVPEDLAFVVQPDTRQGRFMLPVGISAVILAVLVALVSGYRLASGPGDFTDMVGVMAGFGLLVAGVAQILAWRTMFRNGPVLGADRHCLWVGLGGLVSPAALRLDWSEVTSLGVRYTNERRKRGARLGVQLTEDARAQLDKDPGQRGAARKNTALFKAPIVLDPAPMSIPIEEVLHKLRARAPRRVKVELPATEVDG